MMLSSFLCPLHSSDLSFPSSGQLIDVLPTVFRVLTVVFVLDWVSGPRPSIQDSRFGAPALSALAFASGPVQIGPWGITTYQRGMNILCCIIGVFAACQHRRSLLAVFATTNFISFIYNLLLLFWYEGVFPTTSHYALLLSFGLPFSFSFFLKYTPGCSSHFDLKNSYWVQDDCLIPFVHLEAAQSVIHGVLALTCLITTTVVLCTPKKRKRKSKSASLPTVSAESVVSGDIEKRPRSRAPTRSLPDSGSSVRSGYVNSSYDSREDVSAVRSAPNYRMPPLNNHPIQAFPNENYEDVDPEPPQRQPAASQLQYSKRKSKGQSRVVQEERDESFCSSSTTGTIPSLHSLVSFDPKSTNYLTVQERIPTDDSETEGPSTSSGSQQSDDYEVEEVKVEAPPPPDAQYSKVKKRPKKEPPEASFETPRSARDEIPAKPRETRDRDYDQEHEDPAYERISAYRRLGQAAAERARDHRQALAG
ncbi:unnamed protein product, partial [Mesorhabditis spiculigera]